jgi:hypothetical protein
MLSDLWRVVFAGENISNDVRGLDCDPPRRNVAGSAKVYANQANGVAGKVFTTERTGRRETGGGLGNYAVAAIAAKNMTFFSRKL